MISFALSCRVTCDMCQKRQKSQKRRRSRRLRRYQPPDILLDGLPEDDPSFLDFLDDLPDWAHCGGK